MGRPSLVSGGRAAFGKGWRESAINDWMRNPMFWTVEDADKRQHHHCKVIDAHHIKPVAPLPPRSGTSLNYGPAVEISPAGLLYRLGEDFGPANNGKLWDFPE